MRLIVTTLSLGVAAARRVKDAKRARQVAGGMALCLAGSALASVHAEFLPHAVWDALAYGLHGVGLTPLIHHFIEPAMFGGRED